jgi:hypothetical protein
MIKSKDTTIGYHCPYCGMSILNRVNIFSMNGNLIKMKCVCGGSELIVQALKNNKYRLTVPCILCPNSHSFTLSSGAFFQKTLFPFSCKFTALNICFIGRSNQVFEAMKINEEELMKTFAAYEEEYDGEYDDYDENGEGSGSYLNGFEGLFKGLGDFEDLEDFEELEDFEDFDDFNEEEKEPGFILHKGKDFRVASDDSVAAKKSEMNTENVAEQNLIKLKLQSYQIVGQILEAISRLCEQQTVFCQCGDFDGKIVLAGNAVHLECKNCGSYRDIKSTNSSDADYLSGMDELYLDFDD